MTSPPEAPKSSEHRLAFGWLAHARGRLAAWFLVTPASREALLRSMLARDERESFGYWFQLTIAMGIATLGLVLGSTGVVIGAMLISPLMTPIVQTGMGLAVGSAVLVTRAFVRTLLSIAAVVVGACAVTVMLPYHEMTAEIAARTSPTALDLVLAGFCALAAGFTTIRQSDTTSAAAGTAIGISLVPPLCVVGWGLATRQWNVAGGASLLFTANLCAIIVMAVGMFAVLGLHRVPLEALEAEAVGGHALDRFAERLRRLFGSRYGSLLRLAMPVILAAAVYVPLRQALEEVAWKARVRAQVQRLVDEVPDARRAVRSVLSVERGGVALRLVVMGRSDEAASMQRELTERIAAIAGRVPNVEVVAVPDEDAVRQAAVALANTRRVPVEAPHPMDLPETHQRLEAAVTEEWPASAGTLVSWRLDGHAGDAVRIRVLHLGAALGTAGQELFARGLGRRLGTRVDVVDTAMPAEGVGVPAVQGISWLPEAARLIAEVSEEPTLRACVELPAPQRWERPDAEVAKVRAAVISLVERVDATRREVRQGNRFALRVVSGASCPAEPTASKTPP